MTDRNKDHQQSSADDARHAKRSPEPEGGKTDQLKKQLDDAEDRQEALVDEGVEETFPASDPVSVKRIT